MATAPAPSRIPRLTPRTGDDSSPRVPPMPSPAAAPPKPSLRTPQKPAVPSTTAAPPLRSRSNTHSSPSSAVKPSPPPPRLPSATSSSPPRLRAATTSSSRPTTASTAVSRPPTTSSTSRTRPTSSATTTVATPRTRATSSVTASPRVSSTPSSQPTTARSRSTSKTSSASPTRSRAPSNPTTVKSSPAPSPPKAARPPTARTVAATAAAIAPAPAEASPPTTESVKAAAEPAQPQSPSADLPVPTEPSVPIYHAPHFTAATHTLPSPSPATPPSNDPSSTTATPASTTPIPTPPLASSRPRSSLSQAPFLRSRTSSLIEMESKVNEWREAYLHLSIEEVTDWLTRTNHNQPLTFYLPTQPRRDALDKETEDSDRRHSLTLSSLPPPPPLFDCLQSGVLLCELALAIQPDLHLPYKPKAQVGSFLARDNIDGFIRAALGWGVPRSQLFEVDDLVMRKNDRAVVNSLMDITRVVYLRFGIAPPTLVQMELEIAQIEQQTTAAPAPLPPPPPPPQPPAEPTPAPEVVEEEKPRGPRYLPYIADPNDPLDVAVGGLINRYQLDLLVHRVQRGQYHIGEEKVHHLRLVRHLVLVRVGGGWEPLVPMASRKIQELKQ